MKKLAWLTLAFLLIAGVAAVAQEVVPEVEATGFDWNNLWKMAIVGACASVLGAWKSGTFNPKDLDPAKIGVKAVIGLIVGIIAALKGISIEAAEEWIVAGGFVYVIDYVVKAIFRAVAIGGAKLKQAASEAAKEAAKREPPAQP
jgi:hypothetical protein